MSSLLYVIVLVSLTMVGACTSLKEKYRCHILHRCIWFCLWVLLTDYKCERSPLHSAELWELEEHLSIQLGSNMHRKLQIYNEPLLTRKSSTITSFTVKILFQAIPLPHSIPHVYRSCVSWVSCKWSIQSIMNSIHMHHSTETRTDMISLSAGKELCGSLLLSSKIFWASCLQLRCWQL